MDPNLQADLAIRLVVSAVLGGAIGAERELHEHPAGMRTHLLVALGCTLFTELSIYGFAGVLAPGEGAPVDPSRVAAQIVTGIGFLGAGAILKYGTSIRGLTTAASLWSTSAVGMAVGVGLYGLAVVATAIALFSLWPLHRVADLLRTRTGRFFRVRLLVPSLEVLGEVSAALRPLGVVIAGVQTRALGPDRYELELELRLPSGASQATVIAAIAAVRDAGLLETDRLTE